MTAPLRAAVIGLGSMGANHARVFNDLPGVELAAVADTDPERLERATTGRPIASFEDYRHMLTEVRPDLVSVVVPTKLHRQVALDVIAAGAHLLVEKPLAASIEEAREIAAAAARAGLVLTVGHIERFNPAIQELKRRLDEGQGGRVIQIRARRVGPFPHRIRDVGVIHDLAPHDIDIMRHLLDADVERVYAEAQGRINTDHEDIFAGILHFAAGAVGILDINWLTPMKERSLTVLCEKGMFVVNYAAQTLEFYENFAASAREGAIASVTEGPMTRYLITNREPLRGELESFRDAVLGVHPPIVTAQDGLAALITAEALVTSSREHQPVAVGPVENPS
jgi:UDP-N-acetylglucosamine 3-dehydrogenase